MLDTDPDFDRHLEILAEATRLRPRFGELISEAMTDDDMDALVEEGKAIIEEQADQAWI